MEIKLEEVRIPIAFKSCCSLTLIYALHLINTYLATIEIFHGINMYSWIDTFIVITIA